MIHLHKLLKVRASVHYRVQVVIDDVALTSEPYLAPADVVAAARKLSLRADDSEAVVLDERGRLCAWSRWSGEGDDAVPQIVVNHLARADADLMTALVAADPTCDPSTGASA